MDTDHEILASERLRRHCRYSTLLGIGVWWTSFFSIQPWDYLWAITMFLLFVPLVLFRLSFPLLVPPSPVRNRWAWYAISYLQPPAAICLAVSFFFDKGDVAAGLTIPWLAFTLFLGALGLDRLWNLSKHSHSEWGSIAAMIFVPIGATWAYLSRSGQTPLGFSEVIVLLTAIHFHYAGFVLPILGGQLSRFRRDSLSRRILVAIILAVPLVAIGITTTQLGGPKEVEFLAACLLAILGIVMGSVIVRTSWRLPKWSGILMATSGFSLLIALLWSAIYAAGQYGLLGEVTIPQMVYLHGAVNSLGFAFCGLLGWHLLFLKQKENALGFARG